MDTPRDPLENAKRALDAYIHLMTGKPHAIRVELADFGVPDARLDDAYSIAVRGGKGEVLATNPRAALIAAYHLLRLCGCGFARPGASGEVIPRGLSLEDINAHARVENAHRFRGICIEGAVGLDAALDMLEWMPKVGLNTYFMQFREGFTFFDRYYSARHNPSRTPLDFNLDVSRDIANRVAGRARELGLVYHGVGHGFHIECFGIPGLGWDPKPGIWPEKYKHAMALHGGEAVWSSHGVDPAAQASGEHLAANAAARDEAKPTDKEPYPARRAMHWNIPMITALCYENEAVRDRVAEKAAEYIATAAECDYVHVWLDDGGNNKCECGLCKDTRIADSYVKLLNTLDARLASLGCGTKIVFLAYSETLWPPEREVLKNPGRFTFMFAPGGRDCMAPLWRAEAELPLPPYTLNNQPFPKTAGQQTAFLDAWNAWREKNNMDMADSFDFDYYTTRFNDPGQFAMARVIHDDAQNLRRRGLNGVVNCQAQCVFADMALSMHVYAATLLQPERAFDDIADEFFKAAFSPANAEKFRRHFEKLTGASACLRADLKKGQAPDAAQCAELEALLNAPLPEHACGDIGVAEAVRLLRFTQALYANILALVKTRQNGGGDGLKVARDAAETFATRHAAQFENAFDLAAFLGFLKRS